MTSNMFLSSSGTASASRSEEAAAMNLLMRSRTVAHSAGKEPPQPPLSPPLNDERGERCCRKTLPSRVAALVLVSSMAVFSPGLARSRSWSSIGKRTAAKADSHSRAPISAWRSRKRSARWREERADVRMWLRLSQQRRAVPWSSGHHARGHRGTDAEPSSAQELWIWPALG